jgi:predicted Abi (CAAX) family protease
MLTLVTNYLPLMLLTTLTLLVTNATLFLPLNASTLFLPTRLLLRGRLLLACTIRHVNLSSCTKPPRLYWETVLAQLQRGSMVLFRH